MAWTTRRSSPPQEVQLPWFEAQVDLPYEFGLPLFVHKRGAFEDVVRILDRAAECRLGRGDGTAGPVGLPILIVHCFTGSRDECSEYVRRGYSLSVSGFVCRSGDGPEGVRSTLEEGIVPLNRIMIETDELYTGLPFCRVTFFAHQGEAFSLLPGKKRKKLIKGQFMHDNNSMYDLGLDSFSKCHLLVKSW